MLPHRLRFTMGRLMIVVAVAGVLSALLRVPNAVALTVAVALGLVPPVAAFLSIYLASPSRRILVATRVTSLWPLSVLWALHAAWLVAYVILAHHPKAADLHGLAIEVLTSSAIPFIFLSWPSTIVCPCLLLRLTDEQIELGSRWDSRVIPVLLMPLVWFMVVRIGRWDPIGAIRW